jgi:hypothetical protein
VVLNLRANIRIIQEAFSRFPTKVALLGRISEASEGIREVV